MRVEAVFIVLHNSQVERINYIKMVCLRISLLLVVLANCNVHAQTNLIGKDSAQAIEIFKEAKQKFTRFEKQHSGYIQTKNVRMHYLTWGEPTGLPLIWVHGTGQSSYELLPLADSLTLAGYFIIAIDYYGHLL